MDGISSLYDLLLWTAAAAALGIALFTLSRNVKQPINQAAAGLFLSLCIAHVGAAIVWRVGSIIPWLIAEAWLPCLFLLFGGQLTRTPHQDSFRWLTWSALALGLAITTLGLMGFPGLVRVEYGIYALPTYGTWLVTAVLLLHIAALVQVENVFRAAKEETRWRLKYLILGIAVLVVIRVYALTLIVLYQSVGTSIALEFAMATLLGGALFTFAVVRHRLLDVDVFISRYVIYSSLTMAAAGAYLLTVGGIVYGLKRFGGDLPVAVVSLVVLAALAVLGAVLLSNAIRWKLRHFVDRNFYRNRHDYRVAWQAATRAVAAEHTVEGYLTALAHIIKKSLGARYVVCQTSGSGAGDPKTGAVNPDHAPGPVDEAQLVPDTNPAFGAGKRRIEVFKSTSAADTCYLPLTFGDTRIGWVAVGPRVSGEPYHLEDMELANSMAAQTAVAVRNMELADDLAKSRELAALHQLSTFFIHDMKNTTNSLGLLAQNIPKNKGNAEFWDDAERSITCAVEQMRALTERLRDFRQHARPETASIDLAPLITTWAERWRPTVSATIRVDTNGALPCRANAKMLDSVFTNLVLNAAEAGASTISLAGRIEADKVRMEVTDNGNGMDEVFLENDLFKPFSSTKGEGMGIGLFQSRRFIEQLGGSIHVTSQTGSGSCFTVSLPADILPKDGP